MSQSYVFEMNGMNGMIGPDTSANGTFLPLFNGSLDDYIDSRVST